jgi:serine protease Do
VSDYRRYNDEITAMNERTRAFLAWSLALATCLPLSPARALPPLTQEILQLPNVVEPLLHAVVNIAVLKQPPNESGGTAEGMAEMAKPKHEVGSGFIIDPDGYLVTNRHVVDGAYKITVTLDDNTQFPAKVLATNARPDLALLKVDAGKKLPMVKFGDSDALRIGQTVIAIGNPLGLSSSISVGVVSALNRDLNETMIDDFVQTDAAINHGNSGGPLFNLMGEVIGVNWAIVSPTDTSGSIGLGLAIPSNDAAFVVGQMRQYGRLHAGFVGLRLQQVMPDLAHSLGINNTEGGIVTRLWPDGPAAKAGIREGDVVERVGNRPTHDVRALLREMATIMPGASTTLLLWRSGHEMTVEVTASSWPGNQYDPAGEPVIPDRGARASSASLGLRMASTSDDMRKTYKLSNDEQGVVVEGVAANSAGADAGFVRGDVILRVRDTLVALPDDVVRALGEARKQGHDSVPALVQTQDRPHWVVIPTSGQ